MMNNMKTGALLFVAGAAVGAAAAMWLMSDSAKELRNELRDYASQAKDKMQAYCDEMKQRIEAEVKTAVGEEPAPEA
jgi:gas vesicle protein